MFGGTRPNKIKVDSVRFDHYDLTKQRDIALQHVYRIKSLFTMEELTM